MEPYIEQRRGGIRIRVRAQPRSSRSELVGQHDGALKVRLAAPPVGGAANRELVHLLARLLRVPKSGVRLVSGESSRNKVVEVEGIDGSRAAELLAS